MTFLKFRARLLAALRLLARPAAMQASYLARVGAEDAEELRLQYVDAMADAEPFVGRELSRAQMQMLLALTAQLRAMAVDGARLWKEPALRRSGDWAEVRELAAEALIELDAWPRTWGKARRRAIRADAETARKLAQHLP